MKPTEFFRRFFNFLTVPLIAGLLVLTSNVLAFVFASLVLSSCLGKAHAQQQVRNETRVYVCTGDPAVEGEIDRCINHPGRVEVQSFCSQAAPCWQQRFLERVLRQPIWQGLEVESYFIRWSDTVSTIVMRGHRPEPQQPDRYRTEHRLVERVATARDFEAAMHLLED